MRAAAERRPQEAVLLVFLARKAVRIELVGVAPPLLHAVGIQRRDLHHGVRLQLVAAHFHLVDGAAHHHGHWRVHPQHLLEAVIQVGEGAAQVAVVQVLLAQPLQLLAQALLPLLVVGQVIGGHGQRAGGGVVCRQQQENQVLTHHLVGKVFSLLGLLIGKKGGHVVA